jgi:5-methylcytosine-specific restriction endonuclease McrA
MPCSEKRARLLLERGRTRVHRMVPLTIRLVDRLQEDSTLQPVRLKLDSGSQTTGIALERVDASTGKVQRQAVVLMRLELPHRGATIREALADRRSHRRLRRSRRRYRAPRFLNRIRPPGWLPPSLQHRVDTTMTWVERLMRWAPVTDLSQELVRFDPQALQYPEIAGVEYQHGELFGYKVREYLLEQWGRRCAYCDAEHVPLEIEHIHPRSKGGSNRGSHLTLACRHCNERKHNRPVAKFLSKQPERLRRILAQAQAPLHDAAAVNSTRWPLWRQLVATGLPVEVGTGGRTKGNRHRWQISQTHGLDAACVGHVDRLERWQQPVLTIQATGRGSDQRTRLNPYGFPREYLTRRKTVCGFQTGDLVKAVVTTGQKVGTYRGCVAIRASGSFHIQTEHGLVQGIQHRFCTLNQRADGYGYQWRQPIKEHGGHGAPPRFERRGCRAVTI